MRGFGYKTGWLAVRRGDVQGVADVLGGRIAGSVTWEEGIAASYGEPSMLAVTPLLRGADDADWLLVTGSWIASEAEGLNVGALSMELGDEVQLFASHRVVDWHRWDRGRAGVTVRSFEYVGDEETTRAAYRRHLDGSSMRTEIFEAAVPAPSTSGLPGSFSA